MTRLEALCKAIEKHEGWWPLSHSWRYNNPGNLRFSRFAAGYAHGFAYFDSYISGWLALWYDVYSKCTGNTRTGLGPQSSLYDLFSVWAPTSDGNNPHAYAEDVAKQLGVPPETLLAYFTNDLTSTNF